MASYPPPLPRRGPPPLPRTRRRPIGAPPTLPSQRENAPVFTERFRSDRERYDEIDLLAPLNEWVDVVSTWVNRARFEPYTVNLLGEDASTEGDWLVEFLDLALVVYRNTPIQVWHDFINSSSKGQFIFFRCKEEGRAYEELRGPQRKVNRGLTEIQEPHNRRQPGEGR